MTLIAITTEAALTPVQCPLPQKKKQVHVVLCCVGACCIGGCVVCTCPEGRSCCVDGWHCLCRAHQHGIGGLEPNATLAAEFYRRSIQVAGKWRSRSAAPRAALVGMAVDRWLEPLFGPNATTRAAVGLASHMGRETILPGPPSHQERPPMELTGADGSGSAVGGQGEAAEGTQAAWLEGMAWVKQSTQKATQMYYDMGIDKVETDTLVMTVLLGALLIVLWARKRQQGQRAAYVQQASANGQH
jgi:hypothetical protein